MRIPAPYLFLLPAMAVIGYFAIVPMVQIVCYSMLEYSFFGEHTFVGPAQYLRLFQDQHFWRTLLNSLLFTAVTPLLMALSLFLALAVRSTAASSSVLRLIFFLPVITPVVAVGIMWKWIFTEETGLLNYLLGTFGIGPVPWLSHYPTNMASVMIVTLWRGFGYYMVIFLAGLALLPKEMEEASRLDGVSPMQNFLYIVLPNLRPTVLFVLVVSSASAIKLFTELYVLIPGAPIDNKTIVSYLYRQSFERFDFGYGSAIAVVLFALTFVFSYTHVRLMEERT